MPTHPAPLPPNAVSGDPHMPMSEWGELRFRPMPRPAHRWPVRAGLSRSRRVCDSVCHTVLTE